MLKRKLRVKINGNDWSGGNLDQEVELPKRVWTGRNTGIMFRVLFVDPGSEFGGAA
jgi:hypothetical protein